MGEYFLLNNQQFDKIIDEVTVAIQGWETLAEQIGISRADKELMASAFKV